MNLYKIIALWSFVIFAILVVFAPIGWFFLAISIISLILERLFLKKVPEQSNAEKNAKIYIKMFGWMEIVIGLFGTLIFLLGAYYLLATAIGTRTANAGDFALIPMILFGSPFICGFVAGIGVVRLKSWGRKMNNVIIPLILSLLLLFMLVFHLYSGPQFRAFIILDLFIGLPLILFFRWLFNNKTVKEIF